VILDVITAPREPPLVGWHVHGPERHLGPAGRWSYPTPEQLPSRAWRKVKEGLAWARVPLQPGDQVLEFGAAPGGGTQAFAEAGARVLAIDPQPLAPEVLALPGVRFLQRPVGEVRLEELPGDVRWLASDAGIPPAHVIAALRRLVPRVRPTLRGFLLTLKLHDEATVAALPDLLARLRALGCARVRATHLPANRRDIFVYGSVG
jgi:23S rRNA C2498 (ribose-2'-O)-methylase RlmM